jgi:hypothetical protein
MNDRAHEEKRLQSASSAVALFPWNHAAATTDIAGIANIIAPLMFMYSKNVTRPSPYI